VSGRVLDPAGIRERLHDGARWAHHGVSLHSELDPRYFPFQPAITARSSSVIFVRLASGMYLLPTTCLICAACCVAWAVVSSMIPAGAEAKPGWVGLAEWHSTQRACRMPCTWARVTPAGVVPAAGAGASPAGEATLGAAWPP